MAADPLTKNTVDDLFNDDFSDFGDDPFADNTVTTTADVRDDKPTLSPRAALKRKADGKENDGFGLGLDEEVKIVKKRRPVVKLDEARLLSEPGIPKLRTIVRSNQVSKKLRIKGKGHEFTDTARLLNHFQLWLDNLYPRAKFADALQLVEKAGHTKRMHITRTEWINEGKPGYRAYQAPEESSARQQSDPDLFDTETQGASRTTGVAQPSMTDVPDDLDDDALFIPDANRPTEHGDDNDPDDDDLDALLAAQNEFNVPSNLRPNTRADDSEGEDDLDALLAEQDAQRSQSAQRLAPRAVPSSAHTGEDDDLDALLAEQESHLDIRSGQKDVSHENASAQTQAEPGLDDDDELETLLAAQRTRSKPGPTVSSAEPSLPTPQATSPSAKSPSVTQIDKAKTPTPVRERATIFSSSPIPNNPEEVDLDDLEALFASQEAKDAAIAATQSMTRDRDGSVTPKPRKFRVPEDNLLSSSPVPNATESQ